MEPTDNLRASKGQQNCGTDNHSGAIKIMSFEIPLINIV